MLSIITKLAKSISHGGSRKTSQIKYIVIHYTGNKTDTAKGNANYFATSNTRAAGAHYFVDETSIYQSIKDTLIAWAVGGSKYADCGSSGGGKYYGKCTNTNSVSIEMCSTGGAISGATIENAVDLTKSLMKKYNIDADHVIRHFDVNGKHCPGWSGWYGSSQSKWTAFKKKLTSTSSSSSSGTSKTTAEKSDSSSKSGKLDVDGSFGSATVKATQKYFGTTQDGVVSNQPTSNQKYLPNAVTGAWEFKASGYKTGSAVIKKLQAKIGVTEDGLFGKKSVKAFQKFLGVTQDGSMGPATVKAWQTWLNKQ